MIQTFSVSSGAFDGPLDLLLHLIEKNEVDIFDIPIASITEQYIAMTEAMDFQDMDSLSEFLLMAATLLYIKSKLLLPGKNDGDGEPEEDPREELVQRLIAYRQFKEASELLGEMENRGALAFYGTRDESIDWETLLRSDNVGAAASNTVFGVMSGVVPVERLRDLFVSLIARQDRRTDKIRAGFGGVTREQFTIADKIQLLAGILSRSKRLEFSRVFLDCRSRSEKITTFLALLELIKINRVQVTQEGLFDEIYCLLKE